MENKIHDDHLDDYVRRSFEDYEEDPAPDMWGRIEGDLQPAVPVSPRLSFRHYRWQAAAAAVVLMLLCGLVYEHFYYEKKIRDLAAEKVERQKLEEEKPRGGDVFSEKNGRNRRADAVRANPGPSPEGRGDVERAATTSRTPLPSGEGPGLARDIEAVAHPPENSSLGIAVVEIAQNQVQDAPEKPSPTSTDTSQKPSTERAPTSNETTMTFSKPAELTPLAIPIFPVKIEDHLTKPNLFPALIEPARKPSGWYAGLHSTPHIILENVKPASLRPGGRPFFVSQQESPEISADWWLKVGKKLNPRFSIESGIGYSEVSRTAMHTARFRFGDGTTGGSPHRRNFSYDLNTYGGSAAVSLRMEQVDSDPVQDDESVSLRITTSERTKLLRVPLFLAYRLGTGRLHGVVKAGLTGNFFLKNELDIAARVSQNSRFRPVQGSDSYTVQLGKPGRFFLGYWLSAGAEFRLNRYIGLVAEPVFSGDFARKDAAGRQLPGQFSVGLNVGANYYF